MKSQFHLLEGMIRCGGSPQLTVTSIVYSGLHGLDDLDDNIKDLVRILLCQKQSLLAFII